MRHSPAPPALHPFVVLALSALLLSGCYRAVVNTGLQPSGESVEIKWATGFVHGLVPPDSVVGPARCPGGVARVETQHTFLNMLATMVTWGIYSPMNIKVDCARAGG